FNLVPATPPLREKLIFSGPCSGVNEPMRLRSMDDSMPSHPLSRSQGQASARQFQLVFNQSSAGNTIKGNRSTDRRTFEPPPAVLLATFGLGTDVLGRRRSSEARCQEASRFSRRGARFHRCGALILAFAAMTVAERRLRES